MLLIVFYSWTKLNFYTMSFQEAIGPFVGMLQYVGIVLLILCWRTFRWRVRILVPHMLVSLMIFYCQAVKQPQFSTFHPFEMPRRPVKALLHLLFIPGVLLRHSVSYILPVSIFRPLSFAHVALVWESNLTRCRMEMEAVPGQGDRYKAIATAMENFIGHWFPLTFGPASDKFEVSGLTDAGNCTLVNTTLQVVLGCLVPLAVLIVAETFSRKDLENRLGRSTMYILVNKPVVLLFYNLLLVPFQAAIVFRIFVLLLG